MQGICSFLVETFDLPILMPTQHPFIGYFGLICGRNGFSWIAWYTTRRSEEVSRWCYCHGNITWRENLEIVRKISVRQWDLKLLAYTCDDIFAPVCAMKAVLKFQSRSICHWSGCVFRDLATLKIINWGISDLIGKKLPL